MVNPVIFHRAFINQEYIFVCFIFSQHVDHSDTESSKSIISVLILKNINKRIKVTTLIFTSKLEDINLMKLTWNIAGFDHLDKKKGLKYNKNPDPKKKKKCCAKTT